MTASDDTPRRPRSARRAGNDFSRLRSADLTDQRPVVRDTALDQEGKRALFSATSEEVAHPASFGAVVVHCGSCEKTSVLTPAQALLHVVPSIHLPFLKPEHGSWMRCPACRRHTWVSVEIQL
jgi:hypothetical protein